MLPRIRGRGPWEFGRKVYNYEEGDPSDGILPADVGAGGWQVTVMFRLDQAHLFDRAGVPTPAAGYRSG